MAATDSPAQTLQLTLTPSNYNSYNISCFGFRDGSIDLTVTGGTAPYSYRWSTDDTTQDLSNLPAGYYQVIVTDRNNNTTETAITLTEPEMLINDFVISSYPNGYNISCYDCFNGSIYNFPSGGVAPYTYTWEDGPTTKDRITLGRGTYALVIRDLNGCTYSPEQFYLFEPDRSDWTMNGNAGSNPGNNFIGTSDNKDLVFKTNNLERLRILANGNLKINALAGTGNHSLVVDNDGLISKAPCYTWDQCGNIISSNNFIGSKNAVDLKFKVNSDINNNSVMTIKVNGDIGIGTDAPTEKLEIHHQTNIGEAGGINLVNTSFGNFNSEIKFSSQFSFNPLWAIGNDVQHNGQQNFFIFDHTANSTWGATRFLIDADGNIGVGTESPIEKFQVEGGNVFINSENTGLIVDEGGNKRVGFLKYSGKEGGIWRIEGQRFEIGRAIGVTSLPGTPSSLQADMIIDGDGKVGLGVVPTTGSIYRLFVADGIVTNDILVTIGTFPDFVFDDDYKKHSFAELDAFIKQNKHLPWFPSANEVKKMEGVSVADMQKNMLQSIEELTLLIIELKKEIELLKANQR